MEVDKETFLKLLGLNSDGTMTIGDYRRKTRKGYPILKTYKDKFGSKHIVGRQPNGYFVGANYDDTVGVWGQGYYCFRSLENAKNFLENNYIL